MNALPHSELVEQFEIGRRITHEIACGASMVPEYTIHELNRKIHSWRLFKNEKTPTIAYWLGRKRGMGDLRKQSLSQSA